MKNRTSKKSPGKKAPPIKKERTRPELLRLETWLKSVSAGESKMSQRKITVIEKQGGLSAARKLARIHGVHLVSLTDDQGYVLVAASVHPFRAIS